MSHILSNALVIYVKFQLKKTFQEYAFKTNFKLQNSIWKILLKQILKFKWFFNDLIMYLFLSNAFMLTSKFTEQCLYKIQKINFEHGWI